MSKEDSPERVSTIRLKKVKRVTGGPTYLEAHRAVIRGRDRLAQRTIKEHSMLRPLTLGEHRRPIG